MVHQRIFETILDHDARGVQHCSIDSDGFFRYNHNAPTIRTTVNYNPDVMCRQAGRLLYVVGREGDILLSLSIEGRFKSARMFQYDAWGHGTVVYEEGPGALLAPFDSGIPLLQVGKHIYLELSLEDVPYVPGVAEAAGLCIEATFAFLSESERRTLGRYTHEGTDHGIKLKHNDGSTYQVLHVTDMGFSPNYLAKVN